MEERSIHQLQSSGGAPPGTEARVAVGRESGRGWFCPTSPTGTRGQDAPTPSSACRGCILCTVPVCTSPSQQSSSVPSIRNRQEEKNHLQPVCSPASDRRRQGRRRSSRGRCCCGVFPRETASPLGFLTSFFTKLHQISLCPS